MEPKTVVAALLVVFTIGALIFLRVRNKNK